METTSTTGTDTTNYSDWAAELFSSLGPPPRPDEEGQDPAEESPEPHGGAAANACKEGFRSERHFPRDLEAIIKRCLAALLETYRPRTAHEAMAVLEIASAQGKIEKATAMGIADMLRIQDQASSPSSWDSARCEVIDVLGKRLGKEPHRVKRALERSKQGVDWIISKYVRLNGIITAQGHIDEPQRWLLMDLLGIELELRAGNPEVPAAEDGSALLAVCERELRRLQQLQEGLLVKDERWRIMAQCGMPYDADEGTKGYWRYAADARRDRDHAHRLFLWIRSQGGTLGPDDLPPDGPGPKAKAKAKPQPKPPSNARPKPPSRPQPPPRPDLPSGPPMSEADHDRLVRMGFEASVQIDRIVSDTLNAAAAPADDCGADDEPADEPGITPAAILDRAAAVTAAEIEADWRKQFADDERRRRRSR